MKKRLIAVLVLVAVMITTLVGCGIFVTNEERDYRQVVASVEFEGMMADVTKGDLIAFYQQNQQTYRYYDMTTEKIVEECIKTLSKKELLILKARLAFASDAVPKDSDLEKFLRPDEIKYVRELTNEQFQESLDIVLKEVIAEKTPTIDKDEEEDKEENEDIANARPKKTESEDATTYKKDDNVTMNDVDEKFDVTAGKFTDENEKEAWKRLQKSLSDSYKDYNYFYESNLKQRFIQKYKDELNKDITVSDAEIEERYNTIVAQNLQSYTTDSTYQAGIKNGTKDTFAFMHLGKGYSTVKSILLKFNTEQEGVLKSIQSYFGSDFAKNSLYRTARMNYALGNDTGLPFAKREGVKVNVSNPNYDPDKTACAEGCTEDVPCTTAANAECVNRVFDRKDVAFADILVEITEDIKKAEDAAESATDKLKARLDTFEKWIYLVNDDPGMHNPESDYMITPEGKDSQYVAEFTSLGRALTALGVGAMGLNVSELTTLQNGKDNSDTFFTEGGITYCINDFGIHIMMIQYVNVDGEENVSEVVKGKNTYFQLGLDYVYDVKTGETIKEIIGKKILEEKKNRSYSNKETVFFEEFEENSITVNKSRLNKIIKQLIKIDGE